MAHKRSSHKRTKGSGKFRKSRSDKGNKKRKR